MTSSRSKLARGLVMLGCLCSFLAGTASGQDAVDALPLQVSVKQELIKRDPPCYRAYLTSGTAKLAFLVPDYYLVNYNQSRKELNLNHRELGPITLSLMNRLPSAADGLLVDACRVQVSGFYPGATIFEESTLPGIGHGSRIYDLKWTPPGGVLQNVRVAFVPTPAGVVVLRAGTDPANFPKVKAGLDLIINTLVGVAEGELKVMPLSDQI